MEPGQFIKMLSREEVLRYSRQLNLREVGEEGQRRLKNAKKKRQLAKMGRVDQTDVARIKANLPFS